MRTGRGADTTADPASLDYPGGRPDDATPGVRGPAPEPDAAASSSQTGPSIFTAIQEQLGLKLVPSRGPIEYLVIDHIERPSAN